jgi:uncharacterized protein (DUF4415 family)
MKNTSRTDWDRIDAMTDENIDTSDIPPLTDAFFKRAKLRLPRVRVTDMEVKVDRVTLEWFQSMGETAGQHMAEALRIYVEAQKNLDSV